MASASTSSSIVTGARVRVDGLRNRAELNGQLGTVTSLNEDTGRWNVMIDDMREALALKPDVLTIEKPVCLKDVTRHQASLSCLAGLLGLLGVVQESGPSDVPTNPGPNDWTGDEGHACVNDEEHAKCPRGLEDAPPIVSGSNDPTSSSSRALRAAT